MRLREWGVVFVCIVACRDTTEPQAPVPLLLSSISAGTYATCGLDAGGAAYCWGNGRYGQIGVDSAEDCTEPGWDPCAHTPRRVAGGLTFASISAGGLHVCAVTPSGLVYCWGDDTYGQLGTPDTAAICGWAVQGPCARTPQLAYLPPPVTQLSAGGTHSCAIMVATYCWGYGAYGRLGTGSSDDAEQPSVIAAGMRFNYIVAGGASTCGVAAADSLTYCWGYNHLGQLGDSTFTTRILPVRIADPSRFVALVVGTAHACGLTAQGAARCWGGDGESQLGATGVAPDCGGYTCRTTPVPVSGNLQFTALAAGGEYTCGVTATASYCWGAIPGQSGPVPFPTAFGTLGMGGGTPFVQVTAASGHACGVTAAHEAYCWGAEYHGLLGDGPAESTGEVPVLVIAPDSTSR